MAAVRGVIADWLGAFGSDVRIGHRFAHVWPLHNGKAVRFQSFFDKQQALEPVGLEG